MGELAAVIVMKLGGGLFAVAVIIAAGVHAVVLLAALLQLYKLVLKRSNVRRPFQEERQRTTFTA